MGDVGGQDKIRKLWRYYYQNTQGLVCSVCRTENGSSSLRVRLLAMAFTRALIGCLELCQKRADLASLQSYFSFLSNACSPVFEVGSIGLEVLCQQVGALSHATL